MANTTPDKLITKWLLGMGSKDPSSATQEFSGRVAHRFELWFNGLPVARQRVVWIALKKRSKQLQDQGHHKRGSLTKACVELYQAIELSKSAPEEESQFCKDW